MINEILKRWQDIKDKVEYLDSLNLGRHSTDYVKSWDLSKSIQFILAHVKKNELIYDVGSGDAVLPKFLERLKYSNLIASDPIYKPHKEGNIDYRNDYEKKISLENSSIKCITCLSTVEHGLDLDLFFKECKRTLESDGFLILSTDYWSVKIPTSDPEWTIFSLNEIKNIIKKASNYYLKLIEPVDYTIMEPVIKNKYTFIFLIFKKGEK